MCKVDWIPRPKAQEVGLGANRRKGRGYYYQYKYQRLVWGFTRFGFWIQDGCSITEGRSVGEIIISSIFFKGNLLI